MSPSSGSYESDAVAERRAQRVLNEKVRGRWRSSRRRLPDADFRQLPGSDPRAKAAAPQVRELGAIT